MASATLFEDDEEGDEEVVERPRVQAKKGYSPHLMT